MIGTVSIAMKMNIPANQPRLPNYFLRVSVKSISVPAALITKYWVVNDITNATNVKNSPKRSPDWLNAHGMVTNPVPTMAFHTENIVVKDPCFPVFSSISPGTFVSIRFSSIIWLGTLRKDSLKIF